MRVFETKIFSRYFRSLAPINIERLALGLLFACGGFLFAIYVVGWRMIDPLDISWLSGDPGQYYLAWAFFRRENSLTLPFGFASDLGYPLGEPTSILDPIPLAMFLLWPFRNLLPQDFQYLGLWFALSTCLQFYFGYRVSKHMVGDDRVSAVLGGVFFMLAGSFVWRALGHHVLTSQWIVLAALDFFFSCNGKLSTRKIAAAAIVCFFAGSINPYLTLMCLMLVGGGCLRTAIVRSGEPPKRWKETAAAFLPLVFGATVALGSLFAFGFFGFSDFSGYRGEGYRLYSMNALAPIDPREFPALLLKRQPTISYQYEGYNYLGLGVLLLSFAAMARAPRVLVAEYSKPETIPAWLIIAVSAFLAMSLKATLGTHVLYNIKISSTVENILSIFRASGRLFWPAYYLILAGGIRSAYLAFGPRLPHILLLMVIVQFLDMNGLYRSIHTFWASIRPPALVEKPEWKQVGLSHRHLVVIPAWQCVYDDAPGGHDSSLIFGKLAVRYGMTVNSFQVGRLTEKQRKFFCEEQPDRIKSEGLQADTAYVFLLSYDISQLKLNGHTCRALDGVRLCSVVGAVS